MRPRRWPGSFTSSGTGARSSTLSRRDGAALHADAEADAVVRHDHDERVVEEAEPAHSREQLAEQAVRQPDLQQVALVGHLHEPRIPESQLPVEPVDRLGRMAPVLRPEG